MDHEGRERLRQPERARKTRKAAAARKDTLGWEKYTMGLQGCQWFLGRARALERGGRSRFVEKGCAKKYLADGQIAEIAGGTLEWQEAEALSTIVGEEEVTRNVSLMDS